MAAPKPDIMKLADAMVAELNGAPANTFNMPFTAKRKLQVEQKLDELDKLHVWVVPESVDVERQDRRRMTYDARISIGVLRRLKATTTDNEIGQLIELTEQIVDRFVNTTHKLEFDADAGLSATVNGYEWDPIYYPPHLRQYNQVTCVPVIAWQFYR